MRRLSSSDLAANSGVPIMARNNAAGIEMRDSLSINSSILLMFVLLVLEGVKLSRPRHHDGERPQPVVDINCAILLMRRQHVTEPAVCHRRFIKIAADQCHALVPEPCIHLCALESAL